MKVSWNRSRERLLATKINATEKSSCCEIVTPKNG